MSLRRLQLIGGVDPAQARRVLKNAIAEPSNFSGAHDDINFRLKYLEWVERVEHNMHYLTNDPNALGMFGTQRHWQIRSSPATSLDRLWPMIEAEIRMQQAVLTQLLEDLDERIARASAAPGLATVVDTNVFLEHVLPDQVVWQEIVEADQVRLVIPLRVVEELDHKKYDRRSDLADRARRVLPMIQALVEEGGAPGEIREGVTIEIPVDPGPRQRPEDADREVLNTCHELREFSGESAVLVSADTALRLRGEAEGLQVFAMPEKYERHHVS